jgi:hypothetical protein
MDDYNVKDLIANYKDKDLVRIIDELSTEVRRLDIVYTRNYKKKGFPIWRLEEYRKYAGDLLYFLTMGDIPSSIGIEGMRAFTPVIENLVLKGQLMSTVLDKLK